LAGFDRKNEYLGQYEGGASALRLGQKDDLAVGFDAGEAGLSLTAFGRKNEYLGQYEGDQPPCM
jgi:hypothetical protein